MNIIYTPLKDLILIEPFYSEDPRGSFLKSYEKNLFKEHGIDFSITEDFETTSRKGVVRGLHFQTGIPQAKYVRVVYGSIYDVAVDLRSGAGFGKSYGTVLSAANRLGFIIPAGFAHGFQVISDTAIVSYKCAGAYSPSSDTGILWNDRDLDINWPQAKGAILSEKDQGLMTFRSFCDRFGCLPKIPLADLS